jgi:hypothetical protein
MSIKVLLVDGSDVMRSAIRQLLKNELSIDADTNALAEIFGAHVLLDKMNLYSDLIPAIKQFCPRVAIPKTASSRKDSKRPASPSIEERLDAA